LYMTITTRRTTPTMTARVMKSCPIQRIVITESERNSPQ
jgi:hypothetical protein